MKLIKFPRFHWGCGMGAWGRGRMQFFQKNKLKSEIFHYKKNYKQKYLEFRIYLRIYLLLEVKMELRMKIFNILGIHGKI